MAVGEDEVCYVPVCPFLEEACVSVLAFRIYPHVERLSHDHHADRVAQVHLHLRRHVVSCPYGVASHTLQQFQLSQQRRAVYGSPQHAEVVMQADTLYLPLVSVEAESVGSAAYGAVSHTSCHRVHLPLPVTVRGI